jgi:transcriptional regulator with XRE-family HTH domain
MNHKVQPIPASQRIARNLRLIRQSRRISQSQLANLSGVPKSTINDIESGAVNPSVDSVEKLSGSLGVSFEELLSRPVLEFEVRKPEEQLVLKTIRDAGKLIRLLPDPIPGIDMYVIELEPGGTIPGVVQPARGRKFAYCMQGSVDIRVAGTELHLTKGCTAVFPGDEPHSLRNPTTGRALILKIHFYGSTS